MSSFAKTFLRTAGSQLGGYLDDALSLGGRIGKEAATAGLQAAKVTTNSSCGC